MVIDDKHAMMLNMALNIYKLLLESDRKQTLSDPSLCEEWQNMTPEEYALFLMKQHEQLNNLRDIIKPFVDRKINANTLDYSYQSYRWEKQLSNP